MVKKLRLICLVKIVPDVNQFVYDYDNNLLIRENAKSIINPADACAVAAAIQLKKMYDAEVTIISMGPESNRKYLEDLLRRGADKALLITDAMYRGSDTYATSRILSRCIENCGFDLILSGAHSMDGDTAHIPCQIAELLDINVMSNVVRIQEDKLSEADVLIEAEMEDEILTLAMNQPAVIGMSPDSKYKLPFAKYEDLKKDVSAYLRIVTNKELSFPNNEVGLAGSKTKVVSTYPKQCRREEKTVVHNDDAGIAYVYQFLTEKGFI